MGDREEMTPEQMLLRCREVDQQRDELLRQQAALGEHYAAAEREKEEIRQEMERLGTSPQTIRGDITRLTEELKVSYLEYDRQIKEGQSLMDETKRALAAILSTKSQ